MDAKPFDPEERLTQAIGAQWSWDPMNPHPWRGGKSGITAMRHHMEWVPFAMEMPRQRKVRAVHSTGEDEIRGDERERCHRRAAPADAQSPLPNRLTIDSRTAGRLVPNPVPADSREAAANKRPLRIQNSIPLWPTNIG